MRKIFLLLIGCSLICIGAYRWGDTKWENAKEVAIEYMYSEVSQMMVPYIHTYERAGQELVIEDLERVFLPIASAFRTTKYEAVIIEDEIGQDDGSGKESTEPENNTADNSEGSASNSETQQNIHKDTETDSVTVSGVASSVEKKVEINRVKLQEFDYLRQNFYQVDNTTTVGSDLLDVNKLLEKDMTIAKDVEGPQILIYHTHSQEGYADSIPGDASTSVVAVGDYLETLLEQNYGIQVLHHKGQYDVEKRNGAYSKARPDIEQILEENPTIEVVIDLHRDGVPETLHLVTEINGKQTAKIMFFNGLSYTTARGDLEYLANPYIEDNLALSFQMQLTAAEYYPGLTRKIYLKGYRYNLHLCPKSMLVEVGAQTNTFEEAKNAMEPLADILAKVLYNGIYK